MKYPLSKLEKRMMLVAFSVLVVFLIALVAGCVVSQDQIHSCALACQQKGVKRVSAKECECATQ